VPAEPHHAQHRQAHTASITRHRALQRPNRAKVHLRRMCSATRRCPETPGSLREPKGSPSVSLWPTHRVALIDERCQSHSSNELLQCIAWRAGCQAVEATSETSRMESSSRPPRSRTSRRPEDAAAPSASPRLTSLCFGVAHCTAKFRMHQQVALPRALAIFWEAFLRGFRDPAQCDTRVGTSESVLSKALKPPSTPPLRGIASLGGSGGCTLHGAADQQHVRAATLITLKDRAESPWCPQQLSFQEPNIWKKHTSSDQSSRNERSQEPSESETLSHCCCGAGVFECSRRQVSQCWTCEVQQS